MTVYIKPASIHPKASPTKTDVQAWETRKGLKLPPDYLHLLTVCNGGFVFPFKFAVTYPDDHPFFDEYNETTRLDYLYPWSQFVTDNDAIQPWNQKEYVVIADADGGLILMQTSDPSVGAINFWWRNNEAWDSGEEYTTTALLAPSLRQFFECVLKPGTSLSSRWDKPDAFAAANELTWD